MKPAPFKYLAASSLDEVIDALREYGEEAKILAGGQSLVPLMNLRLAMPSVLVDVNRVRELEGITTNGGLQIGAATRQLAVERSAEVRAAAPLLVAALRHVAYPAVRSRGTIGGTLAHADLAAETPAVLLALDGEVVARGPMGERTISADDLIQTHFTTALEPNEVLTRVRLPRAGEEARFGFAEVARKHGDFALVGSAVAAIVDGDGVCESSRIVLFGVADRPVRVSAAEQAIAGRPLGDAGALRDAQRVVQNALDARADIHATAEYRREVAGVLVRRALAQAASEERSQ